MNGYSIIRVDPQIYVNEMNKVVNGFAVYVRLNEYDETHVLYLENLREDTVKKAADALVEQRRRLASLGG
jgi:hypothetical protein